ncbi:MAG: hypothetical protein ACYDGR_07255 [Candidatus Dormibacteria bacterium]
MRRRTFHRTVLVYGTDVSLYSAIRESIPDTHADVFWAGADELEELLDHIDPWPWAVVSDDRTAPGLLIEACAQNPVIVLWLGSLPAGLPDSAVTHDGWTDLVADLSRRLTVNLHGITLAPFRGVQLPDGLVLRSPGLESLLGAYPAKMPIPKPALKWARTVLAQHRVGVDVYYQGSHAGLRPAG